jgi:dipeptidyl-peptidase-4
MGGQAHSYQRIRYPARVSDTFPRQYARTQRLTLGEPRSFTVSPDGQRVVFARSLSGTDNINALWVLDTHTHSERLILDPRTLESNLNDLTDEEKRRRERAREGAGGIVTYACDRDVNKAVTILGGYVVVVDLATGEISTPDIAPGVFDVRLSPNGMYLSFVRGRSLCIATVEGNERVLATDTSDTVSWGSAEFIAAEEMGRFRGYWWSPDSTHIAACRVDVAAVQVWHIADPAHPHTPAVEHRYPQAGTANASVSLHIFDITANTTCEVQFTQPYEYLTHVSWGSAGLIAQTQTRNQQRVDVYSIDASLGHTQLLFTDTDPAWVEITAGLPQLDPDGQLITASDRLGTRSLCVNNTAITPNNLYVRSVISVDDVVVCIANDVTTPWIHDVYSIEIATGNITQVTSGDGVASATGHNSCLVVRHSTLDAERASFSVHQHNTQCAITSLAESPLVTPHVRVTTVGARNIPVAILTPRDGATGPLPVLFDPYGGPHAQRVLASRAAYLSSQWFADQGFVVVIADNIGTPGKGSAWERGIHHDLAGPVLADQLEVLDALPQLEPRADITRVGIRGWSFGGYVAALAVIRRSDRFHAAIAGAPVTHWGLYDTHYTERYLGHPDDNPMAYQATSLLSDVSQLSRPLLLVHGLADDNVVAAHTLQLSSALLAAGKAHEVLPLSGVTHMTPQEEVAENLLLHQLAFLKRHLS